jgi:cytochrome P450
VLTASATAAADVVLHRLLATPEGRADPYPLYRELRRLAPLYRSHLDGAWYASRYAHCRQVLLDPRCGRKPARLVRGYATDEAAFERFGPTARSSMLTEDPPRHTRLRSTVSAFFSPGRIRQLRRKVEQLAEQCLASMVGQGHCDAMAELAVAVPLGVAADLVGIPPDDRAYCLALLEAAVEADRPDPTPEQLDATERSFASELTYFRELIAWRRKAPGDDVVSVLAATGGFDDEELVDMAILLFVGGLSPTANLIGNGLFALLRHPGEMNRLRYDPGLLSSAVEEMLRYDAPVQGNGRTVHEPMEVGGQVLVPGDVVVALVGGANRDPERFADPDRFDVARSDNQPLSFGAGIHHCLGAGLARLQAHVIFGRLMERVAVIELTDDHPPRRPSSDQRGFASLPVQLIPR